MKGIIAFVVGGVIAFMVLLGGIALGFYIGFSSAPGFTNKKVASIFKSGYYSGAVRFGEPDFDSWGQRAAHYLEIGNYGEYLSMLDKQVEDIKKQKQQEKENYKL